MQVTLHYFDQNHPPLGKELHAGERVLFGQDKRADFAVSGEGIAAVHFAIECEGQAVWVHRLVEGMAPVLLNEQAVEKAEVEDGDIVQAGNSTVRVQIRGRDHRKAAPTPRREPTPTAPQSVAIPSRIVDHDLSTGLVKYHDPDQKTTLAAALEMLLSRCEPLLIANFRVAGVQPPDWMADDEDLLSAAPEEVTSEHSLHLLAAADMPLAEGARSPLGPNGLQRGKLLELYHELRPHSAAVLLFSKSSKDEVLKAISFRRGFYCSADALEMFLTQGSKQLAQALVDGLHAILIARSGDTNWAIYANPILAPTPNNLGLVADSGAAPPPAELNAATAS